MLAHAERCRAERARLEQAEVETERAEAALAEARAERDELAARSRPRDTKAAPQARGAGPEELAALAMESASFEVVLEPRDEVGPTGAERVEFLLAPNPGVPAAPIRDAASGGELSRVMLALMTVAGTGESRTLVFDEVDAGVGGQTARAVGERLRALGEARQVLCITHLPQIAALAGAHFRIEKSAETEHRAHDRRVARGRRSRRRAVPHARRGGLGHGRAASRRGAAGGRMSRAGSRPPGE